ncbi:MAG: M48 family metallopeptidase [Candidatus Omnitrophota bacterium]
MNIYQQIQSNNHKTWAVVTIFVIFFGFIGYGFDYFYFGGQLPIFTFVALGISFLSIYLSFQYGDRFILHSSHARLLDLNDSKEKQWQNIVEEMTIASGLARVPTTYVIDDSDPNAFATGINPQTASIAVTKGLLNSLNREELQGVAAHEMSHIKNYDVRFMLFVSVLVGAIVLLSDWATRIFRYTTASRGRSRDKSSSGGPILLIMLVIWLIAVILAPILSQLIAMCVSRSRESLADASGAEISRNPLALASALEKIDSAIGPTKSITRGTAALCICDPQARPLDSKEGWFANLMATHPPIQKRIEALQQMAYIKQ